MTFFLGNQTHAASVSFVVVSPEWFYTSHANKMMIPQRLAVIVVMICLMFAEPLTHVSSGVYGDSTKEYPKTNDMGNGEGRRCE